ncbi:MAG: cupredoxin domain-containing protein [Patescibacteria group bacterium]
MKKNILIIIIILILAIAAILAPKFITKWKNGNSEIEDLTMDSTSSTKLAAKKGAKAQTAAISIKDFAFSPASKTVSKGTKITWTNKDNAPHTVMSDDKNGPKSQLLNQNSKYSFIFDKTGTFKYYCSVHPTMTGTITVK